MLDNVPYVYVFILNCTFSWNVAEFWDWLCKITPVIPFLYISVAVLDCKILQNYFSGASIVY